MRRSAGLLESLPSERDFEVIRFIVIGLALSAVAVLALKRIQPGSRRDLAISLASAAIAAIVVVGTYDRARRRTPCQHRRVLAKPPVGGSEVIAIECLDCHATGRGEPLKHSTGALLEYRHVWDPHHHRISEKRSGR